jgi:putative aminopeptidase FrvX
MNRRLWLVLVALVAGVTSQLRAQEAALRLAAAERLLSRLIETYGVSGHEEKVRALIISELPKWAKPETDSAGNLWVRAGKGGAPVVLVAHMDELGYDITSIREDGTLEVTAKGGMFFSLWEGRPALIHTATGDLPGVFLPRDSAGSNTRRPAGPPRVDPGAGSRAAAEAMGIAVGQSITSPKEYTRLAGTRATGRSFDDRVGCAALLIALRRLDVARLRHEVIFVFSVREETGLDGARAVAASLGIKPARVHAIDTFVSSDSPLEVQTYGNAPLGKGPVVRALDNSSVSSPAQVDSLVTLVRAAGYPIQTGATSGGNDGSVFLPYGVPDVPVGWPLRYAHSPAEVIDLKDVVGLSEVVRLIAERW